VQITIINQQKKIPVSKRATRAIVLKTLKILKANQAGQLTVVYVNNRTIQELNYQFLGKRSPTDVLCFDLSEGGRLTADIVISIERARENSRLFKTSLLWETRLYLVHAILHLFGFTDKRAKDRTRMQRKALRILKAAGN
jgi:probable rRNA maturation factor